MRLPRSSRLALTVVLAAAAACAPRAGSLAGTPAPSATVPASGLPAGHTHVVFRWHYEDPDMEAQGEGSARLAAPDSARLDFFVDPGIGAGYALLVGDELDAPGIALVRRYLPPPPMLWAALGRLSVAGARDTVVRVDGATIRADIGRAPVWRAAFTGGRLARLERIDEGRVIERMTRTADDAVRYEHLTTRRVLTIRVSRQVAVAPFDATIWRP